MMADPLGSIDMDDVDDVLFIIVYLVISFEYGDFLKPS